MRLFIGLFPPKEILDELRDVIRKYAKHKRNLKFIPVDQLHITLKYIGNNVSEQSFEIIMDELDRLNRNLGGASNIEMNNISFGFPKDTFPKYLLANVKTNSDIKFLGDEFHNFIKVLKLRDTYRRKIRSQNDYHITLARLKKSANKSNAKLIQSDTRNKNLSKLSDFEATEAYLVQSIVKRGKPVKYQKLKRVEF